ncbi:conserved hypothetical protein [Brucella melitensis M5-90]|nr:conserved hypothetical protein [Brucella melitensis M28]ADZ88309.1 conserved hypothetical protein [Brucella melitensis M5-90]AEW15759.1 hypothetical protein BCA52141_II0931 [Brucella canis HSK A52141]AEW18882.1 hypothetical protein BAA13334_II00523 [Brucella abortus A13334]EFG35869.1 predicted protein [Brucella sp. NVSL 07-0026]
MFFCQGGLPFRLAFFARNSRISGLFRPVAKCTFYPIWGLAACCSSHVGDNDRKRL